MLEYNGACFRGCMVYSLEEREDMQVLEDIRGLRGDLWCININFNLANEKKVITNTFCSCEVF